MEHPNTGIIKEAPIGFSWTTLLFSGFPALLRGDFKWCFIQFILTLITCGISQIVFSLRYNKIFVQKLLERGYKVRSVEGGSLDNAKQKLGINFPKYEGSKP